MNGHLRETSDMMTSNTQERIEDIGSWHELSTYYRRIGALGLFETRLIVHDSVQSNLLRLRGIESERIKK